MALSGIHVTAGYAGGQGTGVRAYAIFGRLTWSETMVTAGTTTLGAPPLNDTYGEAILRVRPAVDAYVAIGIAPNATSGTRTLVPANEDRDFYAAPGERLAWVAA